MTDFEEDERDRPEFEGSILRPNPVTGKVACIACRMIRDTSITLIRVLRKKHGKATCFFVHFYSQNCYSSQILRHLQSLGAMLVADDDHNHNLCVSQLEKAFPFVRRLTRFMSSYLSILFMILLVLARFENACMDCYGY